MANSDLEAKRKLIEATEAVRKKFKQIKNAQLSEKFELDKFYEPVTKPLMTLSNVVSQQQQSRPTSVKSEKKEISDAQTSTPLLPQKLFHQFDSSVYTDSPFSPSVSQNENDHTYIPFEKSYDLYQTPPAQQPPPTTPLSQSPEKILRKYINGYKKKPSLYDTVYGVRFSKNGMYMGDSTIKFEDGKVIIHKQGVKPITFDGSIQLYNLLFFKNPPENTSFGSENVFEDYKNILMKTNALHIRYDKNNGFTETKWPKYLHIIKPLVTGLPYGKGMKRKLTTKIPSKKLLLNGKLDYVYWNKPKELVDRLRLLWSSKMAGHTGHDNEILSIIEELREEGLIY